MAQRAAAMGWHQVFASRVDPLIGLMRAALAGAVLLAFHLDPTRPAPAGAVYQLLLIYLLFALLVAFASWRRPEREPGRGVFLLAFDLVVFTTLLVLAEDAGSPVFVFFTFWVLAAALKWRWRGAAASALIALVVFLAIELSQGGAYAHVDEIVARSSYFLVIAVMLGYVGWYQERIGRRIIQLSQWPGMLEATDSPVPAALAYAARVFEAPRLVFAWCEREEPWLYLAVLDEGRVSIRRAPPTAYEPLVAPALADEHFLFIPRGGGPGEVVRGEATQPDPVGPGHAVNRTFRNAFGIGTCLCLRVVSERLDGRLFVGGKTGMGRDDLLIGQIVAGQIADSFSRWQLDDSLRRSVAVEERMRFARDLHDGVLQSLAGAALQLQTAVQDIATAPDAARRRLADLQDTLEVEQRELRTLIATLQPIDLEERTHPAFIEADLAPLVESLRRQWRVAVRLAVEPERAVASTHYLTQLRRIFREAVANAVRHGAASEVSFQITVEGGALGVAIRDNGRGFPQPGRFDHDDLVSRRLGPHTMLERVAALGGRLSLTTGERGSVIDIRLPGENESAH